MKHTRLLLLFVLVFAISVTVVHAQTDLNQVRLFQSYFFDAPISKTIYGEGALNYATYEYVNVLDIGAKGGYPVNEKIEVQAGLSFLSWSPDEGDGQSGLSDLGIYGRYNIKNDNKTNISAGGLLTLPIGSEDVGQSNLNFGAFGAIRHTLDNGMVITGTLGLIFYETTTYEEGDFDYEIDPVTGEFEYTYTEGKEKTEYENYLNIGLGGIYPVNEQMNAVGELTIRTEGDYMMLSGGVDYLMGNGRVRGALGLGLDDGAPDFQIMGGYSIAF